MNDAKKIKAIQLYLVETRKKLNAALDEDSEYLTSTGNGVNCCEANAMFREVETEINTILKGD